MPREKGQRCAGYVSSDGRFAFCTREEHAGGLTAQATEPPTYRHLVSGSCGCGREHSRAELKPAIVAEYGYTDASGKLLFQVVRYVPKAFKQRRPDGNSGWIWNLRGVQPVLYRLQDVISAVEQGTPIFVVEGEKDVEAVERAGGVATCNAMGAGKWRDEYAHALRGAEVIVVADRDAEGRRHAQQVAASLHGVAASLHMVEPASGKDAHDHLTAGRGLDDFTSIEEPMQAVNGAEPFVGLSHAEVLELHFDDDVAHLVDDLIERGSLVQIAGVPETYKSWLAQAIAVGVACGDGEILGRRVQVQGPVGFFWQDDTRRAEAERVQLYARVQGMPEDLPIRWFLNEGATLPVDLERLQATIEKHGFVLVVLDSFYNFAAGVDLKDREAGALYAQLKAICDRTGCTVLVVDHMPWATDNNRGRLRGYGDVFKGAATRAGIYIDADKNKLFIEARGNNIKGFRRSLAYWDVAILQLKLAQADASASRDAKVEQRGVTVLAWLADHPGRHSTAAVRRGAKGRESLTDEALELLKTRAEVVDSGRDGGPWSGRRGDPRYWSASIHAPSEPISTSAKTLGPTLADLPGWGIDEPPRPPRPTPYRGAEVDRADQQPQIERAEIERIDDKYRNEDQAA